MLTSSGMQILERKENLWTDDPNPIPVIYRKDVVYPKITIVTPSFNQGEFLETTIRSVLLQNYPNLEYIIIDGGSTDNSVEIIKKYEKQIHYWVSEKDSGQSHAINKGLEKATGAIVNWLNSDDYLFRGALATIAHLFMDNHEVNVVCGKSRFFGEKLSTILSSRTYLDPNSLEKTLVHTHIEQPSTFFKMEACRKMGPLTDELHYIMDKEWWTKYLLLFGVKNVLLTEEFFVNFRFHNNSKTVNDNSKFYDEQASLLRSLSLQKGLNHFADLLDIKYKTKKDYKFESDAIGNLDTSIVEAMLIYFLLRWGHLIYSENDFVHAQALLNKVNFEKYTLCTDEKDWLEKLKKNARGNWFSFRVKRKINWTLKNGKR